jgi:hypothetical protein
MIQHNFCHIHPYKIIMLPPNMYTFRYKQNVSLYAKWFHCEFINPNEWDLMGMQWIHWFVKWGLANYTHIVVFMHLNPYFYPCFSNELILKIKINVFLFFKYKSTLSCNFWSCYFSIQSNMVLFISVTYLVTLPSLMCYIQCKISTINW